MENLFPIIKKSRIKLRIISMYFFSDSMNVYFQKVSVCCLLPHYLSLNNLTWVDKAQSTQSNYSKIPLKSQEYNTEIFSRSQHIIRTEGLRFLLGFFVCLFDWKEAVWYSWSSLTLLWKKVLLPIFFLKERQKWKKIPNLLNFAKCVRLLLKPAQPKAYKLVSGGRKGHKKKTTWLAFQ